MRNCRPSRLGRASLSFAEREPFVPSTGIEPVPPPSEGGIVIHSTTRAKHQQTYNQPKHSKAGTQCP